MSRKIVALGHSHIAKFHKGYERLKEAGRLDANLEVEFIDVREGNCRPIVKRGRINEELRRKLENFGVLGHEMPDAIVVSVLGGNQLPRFALLDLPETYDFILPFEPDLPLIDGARILHYTTLASVLRSRVQEVLDFLKVLKGETQAIIVQVEHPPVIEDNVYVRSMLGKASPLKDEPLSPAQLRAKIWKLHSRVFADACAALGVLYLRLPPRLVSPEGYLVRQAWGTDPFHGNEWYGEQVFAHVQDVIRALPRRGAKHDQSI